MATIKILYSNTSSDVSQWVQQLSMDIQKVYQSYISKDVRFQTELIGENSNPSGNIVLLQNSADIDFVTKPEQEIALAYLTISDIKLSKLENPYRFFTNSNRQAVRLSSDDEALKTTYWQKVVSVVFAIGAGKVKKRDEAPGVYVAEAGADQLDNRELLCRELMQIGYDVYPKAILSDIDTEATEQVKADMEKCLAAIVFIGTDQGKVILGKKLGVVEFQHMLLQEIIGDKSIPLMLWFDHVSKFSSENELSYLQRMQTSIELAKSTELIHMPVEKFKTTVIDRVNSSVAQRLANAHSDHTSKQKLYIIAHDGDSIVSDCHSQNNGQYEILTADSSSPSQLLKAHRNCLSIADFVMISITNQSIDWVKAKLQDVLKAPGMGREKELLRVVLINNSSMALPEDFLSNYENTLPLVQVEGRSGNDITSLLK